ncbi:hypothetical protein OH76DRAFT_1189870 [Lentinus brumalis]|uniref:Secreted protein n=1 Tax=Lentinus brumalis TaxID=2498619 RepID=A0A371CTJ1_9APHY|nr:hypothetical protein OH76DRAFT_1189870 [Polyporus brumalis]
MLGCGGCSLLGLHSVLGCRSCCSQGSRLCSQTGTSELGCSDAWWSCSKRISRRAYVWYENTQIARNFESPELRH